MAKILIVEDEKAINDLVKFNLELVGHECCQVFDGEDGLNEALKLKYDLIILDVMLPNYSGFEIIEYIKKTPVIFVTAKSATRDKIKGLRLGADDYITKPFVPVEVLARVRSQLRRYARLGSKPEDPAALTVGSITLNDVTKSVTVDGESVPLTPTEYSILKLLISNPGKVYSTTALYAAVWNEAPMGSERAVAVHIRHLREKIEINPADLKIDTFRSSGAGGQHINKTDSAIRITHLPTGVVVSCQNERSQHKNREMAMKMLISKLLEKREAERLEREQDIKGDIKNYLKDTFNANIIQWIVF